MDANDEDRDAFLQLRHVLHGKLSHPEREGAQWTSGIGTRGAGGRELQGLRRLRSWSSVGHTDPVI